MSDYTSFSDKDIQRFWGYVDKGSEIECWEWTGLKFGSGYGLIRIKYKNKRAHRVAWELIHGEIPEGLVICHHCDNRKCCNPSHLFLGTVLDNVQDRDKKGRHNCRKGEDTYNHKLTRRQVEEIRERYSKGGTSHAKLAREYGVVHQTIYAILKRKTWK